MLREPAVADRFYPGAADTLERAIKQLHPQDVTEKQEALALICPHAGYIYSGKLACKTIASAVIPESVIIIGPNHHGRGAQVAVSMLDWNMPNGIVPVDRLFAEKLLNSSRHIKEDETAHQDEHSLEVQIPFLQESQPKLKIVPIAVSHINYPMCEVIAESIVSVIESEDIKPLILASTDMSHYESRQSATARDKLAIDMITKLDPKGLYQTVFENNISMCGVIPVTITLLTAKALGATTAELIGYTDSGAISGDTGQVVGYAGFAIS